ncbi:MAG TPA: PKD domain-containing protein, partial [Candidatus Thermoplasmatota archaeon]|nr:PKD domain-containing protein [Candidatus Thermoplasmatota archaeon]
MRNNWGWLVVVSLLTVGLSGCFGGDEPVQDDQEHGDDTGDGNMTAENITAVIAVTINGTAANPINGSIATFVGTNVTFDGSGSNGTNLSYAWAFDDDTSGTNVTEVHAFAAPGLFNVTLSVSQGNTTAQASVMLNVSVSGPQTGDLVWTDKKAFTGNLPVGNPNAASQ